MNENNLGNLPFPSTGALGLTKVTTTFSFLSLTYRDAKIAKFTEAKEPQKLEMSLS